MYCIRCGKETKTAAFMCEECGEKSGYREKEPYDIENRRKAGLYLLIIGAVLILTGLLSPFILIKTDAPEDYVAEIFYETKTGPVEVNEEEETQTTESPEDKQNVEEIKGYSYSIASYLMKKQVPEDAAEDVSAMNRVAQFVREKKLAPVDLSDADTKSQIENGIQDENAMKILESYSGVNVQGVWVIILCVISIATAIFLAVRKDFRWSMLFALIATCPVWMLIVKLNKITAWEFESGMYFFMAGIFIALIAGIVGGNTDTCPRCKTELPGGAAYCHKCGAGFGKSARKESPQQTQEDSEWKDKIEEQLLDE